MVLNLHVGSDDPRIRGGGGRGGSRPPRVARIPTKNAFLGVGRHEKGEKKTKRPGEMRFFRGSDFGHTGLGGMGGSGPHPGSGGLQIPRKKWTPPLIHVQGGLRFSEGSTPKPS